MTSTVEIKPRLVRCPKCRKLLLELGDLPVYECGGCGATLIAKYHRNQQTVNSEGGNGATHDTQNKDLASSSERANGCSTEASDLAESEGSTNLGSQRITSGIPSSGDLPYPQEEESLSNHAGEKRNEDQRNGKESNSQTPSPERRIMSAGSSSNSGYERPFNENNSSRLHNSPISEMMETSLAIVRHAPDNRKSKDVMETTAPIDDGFVSEDVFHNNLADADLGTSRHQKSRSYNAYDGSVSSSDGWDDQVSNQHLHLYKKSSFEDRVAAAFIGTETEVQRQERKLSLISLNHNGSMSMDGDGCNQDESLEPTRYETLAREEVSSHYSEDFHQVKSWLGIGKEEFVSKEPVHSTVSENGGPSNYRHDEYLQSSRLYSPNGLEFVERNQMELLRKVDELRDQVNRSYTHDGKTHRGFPSRGTRQEKYSSSYYNHKAPNEDMLRQYDVNYTQQPREAYRPRSSLPHQYVYPPRPFSGIMSYRHQANCPCSNCYQANWHYQQNLPPPNVCCNEGTRIENPGRVLYTQTSDSSSQQRRLHSHYSMWSHDMRSQPYEQIDIDKAMEKLQYRERHQSLKRHILPMAGAAPFVMCYKCSKLLQLPVDFLVSSKGRHRLQCSSCSKVLVFSLHETRLGPYSSNPSVAPLAEAGNSDTSTSMKNLASISHPNSSPQDRVSYSEDYDISICKGASTAGTPASPAPTLSSVRNESVDKRKSPISFSKLTGEKGKHSIRDKQKNSFEVSDSSSEADLDEAPLRRKARQPRIGSPLHRLMGYSSARELINSP